MPNGVTHDNKDVLFKVLSQNYKNKSFEALGLHLPRIKEVLPTQFPSVSAAEVRADNIFLLEDGRILIIDYESKIKIANFIKYIGYVHGLLKMLYNAEKKIYSINMAVIYTGDITEAPCQFDTGGLQITIDQVFLSNFNTDELFDSLRQKVEAGEALSEGDIMKFIILPLTEPKKKKKQMLIEKTINLAKKVADEENQLFIIAGILTATDKFIDRKYSNMIKEWIKMTKVARLFEEEKIEAINQAIEAVNQEKLEAVNQAIESGNQARKQDKIALTKKMLAKGKDILEIMEFTELTKKEILTIQANMKP